MDLLINNLTVDDDDNDADYDTYDVHVETFVCFIVVYSCLLPFWMIIGKIIRNVQF